MGMRVRSQVLKVGGLVLFVAGWAVGAGAQTAQGAQVSQRAHGRGERDCEPAFCGGGPANCGGDSSESSGRASDGGDSADGME